MTSSDYEIMIERITTYFKEFNIYESFKLETLLLICEEGSILDKMYNGKIKIRYK